jgi:DNA-binding CsgD family transcriptional regulator
MTVMLHITPDERDALQLLAIGATKDSIAGHLGMSASDVESLIRGLLARMDVVSESDAIAAARRRGLLDARYAVLPGSM